MLSYPECPYSEKRNHPGFVDISPTLVIDTSMEMSSRVLATAWKHQNLKKISKKCSKLNFDLCRRAEIIQVGRNMHLYDVIGDASTYLRGSTSSSFHVISQLATPSQCI